LCDRFAQKVNFEIWYLDEFGLACDPVQANDLNGAEAIALSAYGELLIEVRTV
jgi:hypothetical protein